VGDLEHIADVVWTESGSDLFDDDHGDHGPSTEADADPSDSVYTEICRSCEQAFTYARYVTWGDRRVEAYPKYRCPSCQEEEEKRQQLERKREHFDSAMFYQYRDGDRGSRLAEASFDEFEQGPHNAQALSLAKTWMSASPRPNVIIVGPIGSGKSYLAACLYRALTDAYEPTFWVNVGTLMAQIRRGFADKDAAQQAGERIESAGLAPFLVLDDLGKVHPGKDVSWVEETFYAIIDARYRNALPTIVTTEWKSQALEERVGASVVSRLEAGAWVLGLKKPATSYRLPAQIPSSK